MGGILSGVGNLVGQVPIVGGLAQGALGTVGGMFGGGGQPAGGYGAPSGYPGGYGGYPAPGGSPYGGGAPPAGNPMQGLDFTKQGAGESFYGQNQSQYTAPGMGERYSANVMDRYGAGTPGVTNNAATQYSSFQQNQPNLSQNLDPYYNNAIRRGEEDIRTNMASKGAYGSSTADDQTRELVTNLRAEQANREGQYGLERAGELRNWQATGGALASGADSSSRGASDNERGWVSTLGDIAGAGQGMAMGRLGQGMNAATTAQGLQRNRGQDYFNNAATTGGAMAGIMGPAYESMISGDVDAMGNQIGLSTGLGAEALNQDYRNTERFMSDMERTQRMMGGGAGKGKGK